MTESFHQSSFPPSDNEILIQTLTAPDLHHQLGQHLRVTSPGIVWPNHMIMPPEYSDGPIERGVAAHILGFVGMHARSLQLELQIHGLELQVIPEETALNGLRNYYEHLRTAQSQGRKNSVLNQQKNVLHTKGREYAEPYILMGLRRDLQTHPVVSGLSPTQREHLLARDLLDVAGGLGTAIQPPSLSEIKRRRRSTG